MDAPADARHGQVRHGEPDSPCCRTYQCCKATRGLEGCLSNLCWPQVLLSSGHVQLSTALAQLVAGRLSRLVSASCWMPSKMLLCLPVLRRNVSLLHRGKTTIK